MQYLISLYPNILLLIKIIRKSIFAYTFVVGCYHVLIRAGGGGGGGGGGEGCAKDFPAGGGGNQPRGSQAAGTYSGAVGFTYNGDGGGGGGGGGGRYGGLAELQAPTCAGASGGSNYLSPAVAGATVNGNSGGTAG